MTHRISCASLLGIALLGGSLCVDADPASVPEGKAAALPDSAHAAAPAPVSPEKPAASPVTAPAVSPAPAGAERKAGVVTELKGARPARKPNKPVIAWQAVEPVDFAMGQIHRLALGGHINRVAIGNGALLSATTVNTDLLLIGEAAGSTTLMVWTDNVVHTYRVTVLEQDPEAQRAKLTALTANLPNVRIQNTGSGLVLSGRAHADEIALLQPALANFHGVINNIQPDDGLRLKRSVVFRLRFIEIKRSLMQKLGVQWDQAITGPTVGVMGIAHATGPYSAVPQPVTSQTVEKMLAPQIAPPFSSVGASTGGYFLGLGTTITSIIHIGETNGDARVLASPELVARSGGKADMNVGGEVPIPIAGPFGSTSVDFKPYGVLFSIEPQVDENDVITAKVATEVSQIDPSVTVMNIPGFLTRKTSAEISIKPGEVVALAGLLDNELSTDMSKVPGLGNIPILGRLFRSDDFLNRKTDLVVLLEPEIVSPGDGLPRPLLEHGKKIIAQTQEMVDDEADRNKVPDHKETPAPQHYNIGFPHEGEGK